MEGNFKHMRILKCKFNDSGYCKFGSHCRKRHFFNICPNVICKTSDCQARHPKRCKHEEKCKFFKQGICAYKHDTLVNHGEKVNSLENENKRLKEENTILKHKINQEVSITEKLKSEIHDLNQAIKMKNELIDKLQLKDSEKASVPSKKANYKEQQLNQECPKCQFTVYKIIYMLSVHSVKCTKCEKNICIKTKTRETHKI